MPACYLVVRSAAFLYELSQSLHLVIVAQPAWDRIASEFKGSAAVLIGDVDCTLHTDLCRYDTAALRSTTFQCLG